MGSVTSYLTTRTRTTARLPRFWYTSQRPYLCSFGDSINSQDVPVDTTGASSGIAPTLWVNALSAGAFDYMMFDATLVGSGGTQATAQTFRNGMSGYSGGLVTQRGKYAIDNFLAGIVANTGGRPFVVLLLGGINDLSNNDITGYDATIWTDLKTIIEKVQAAGGLPLVKVNEPTRSIDTLTKRRNRAALADTIQTWAAGRTDVAVMDVEAAWRQYGLGVTWERATRGTVGDEVHPNLLGAILHGYAGRDALRDFVRFAPPWARSDFAGTVVGSVATMTGTAGTEGTGADAAGEVPTGWTSNTYGANTSLRCDQEVGPEGYGTRLVCAATGIPVGDTFGLSSSAAPSVTAGAPIYRAFVDMDVVKADFVSAATFSIRATGSTFYDVGKAGTTDQRSMTAASGTTTMSPSGARLLAGQRVVLSSQPFVFPASPTGTLHYVGGGNALTDPSARWEAFVRFAGLIAY